MESYLQMINRLPLDKNGKLEFVKNHIKTLKKYEQEEIDNRERFSDVLWEIENLGNDFNMYCYCFTESKLQQCRHVKIQD